MNKLFYLTLFGAILCCQTFSDYAIPKTWVLPDAWARSEQSGKDEIIDGNLGECPTKVCEACDCKDPGDVSKVYFKQLITSLFDREKLESERSGVFSRSLILTISETQLHSLEHSVDPRDWDAVISDVFSKVRTPERSFSPSWFSTLGAYFIHVARFLLISEVRFTLILLLAAFLIVYLHKRYKYGLFLLFIIVSLLIGYIYTYFECNRQLEIESLADLMMKKSDPCVDTGFKIFGFTFWGSSEEHCIQHLKNKNRIKLPYCRPDHVLFTYMNDILFHQFQVFVEKTIDIFQQCSVKIRFPYNIIAMIFLPFLLVLFIKQTFKHILSPSVWMKYMTSKEPPAAQPPQVARGDSLSGDNLKLFLETLKHTANANAQLSGVQELDAIEGEPPAIPPPQQARGDHKLFLETQIHRANLNAQISIVQDSSLEGERKMPREQSSESEESSLSSPSGSPTEKDLERIEEDVVDVK